MFKFIISLKNLALFLLLIMAAIVFQSYTICEVSVPLPTFSDVLTNNWELILLLISEFMALLPGKYSGIIKLFTFFFRLKKKAKKRISK